MAIRQERLKEVIREEASELILHQLNDPRIGFCTVTKIDLTADLSFCTIFVSVMGNAAVKSRTMRALQDARGLIQVHIAKRMKTRTTPHVAVELDESIERSFAVLDKIKLARESDTDGGKTTEPDSTGSQSAAFEDEE